MSSRVDVNDKVYRRVLGKMFRMHSHMRGRTQRETLYIVYNPASNHIDEYIYRRVTLPFHMEEIHR